MMPRRHALGLALAAFILPAAPWAHAQAVMPAGTQAPREFTFDLPVAVDGRVVGELAVVVLGSGLVAVDAESWRAFGPRQFAVAAVESLAAGAVDGRIDVRAFEAAGISLRYDPGSLVLFLQPQNDQRVMRALSMQPTRDPATLEPSQEGRFSSYVNLRALQEYSSREGRPDANALRVLLDGATRLFGPRGVVFEWSGVFEGSAPRAWTRGEMRLVHDDHARAVRYAVGDINFLTTEFQGAVPLLGVSAERRFVALRPLRTLATSGLRSFVLPRPSRVAIYINGALQRTFQLDPGRYGLSDFASVDGANDVRIEVVDDVGERQVIEFTLFLDATLLRRGETEFSLNAGLRRLDDAEARIAYDDERPAWSGFARYGVTETLTVGASIQGERGLDVFGAEAVTALPVGTFSTSLSLSRSDRFGEGRAATARWSYDFAAGSAGASRRLDLSTIFFSDRYVPLGIDEPFNRFSWQTQARLTTALPWGFSSAFNARYAQARSGFGDDETRLGVVLSRRFGRVSTTFGVERITGGEDDVRATLNVLVPLGRDRSLAASVQSLDQQARLEYAHFPTERVGNVSGTVGLETSDLGDAATGHLAYVGNRFAARLDHDVARSSLSARDVVNRSRLQFDTALAFVDGHFAVGRPITDAFVLVSRHKTLKDSEVLVDPAEQGPFAIADDLGPALVPRLLSYRPQQLRWDVAKLPDGYDIGRTERDLFPSYRAGYLVQVGSAASLAAIGVAVHADGRPLELVGGEIRAIDGRDFAPSKTFTNRSGRFAVQGLAPGRYRVTFLTDPPQAIEFEIGDAAAGLVNLGTLTLKAP